MTRLARTAAALFLPLALAQTEIRAQSASARASCFALQDSLGNWVSWYTDSAGGDRESVPRNAIIYLSDERQDAPYEVYRARVAADVAPFRISWLPQDADSVRIVYSDGLVGVACVLAVRGDSLRGFAQGISDVGTLGGPAPRRDLRRGARLPCPKALTSP